MNEYVIASLPVVGQLSTLINWLLLFNALLIGGVVLCAYYAAGLRERVRELEQEISHLEASPRPLRASPATDSIEDDYPIPLARRSEDSTPELHPNN